jgi:hypothetical protein
MLDGLSAFEHYHLIGFEIKMYAYTFLDEDS